MKNILKISLLFIFGTLSSQTTTYRIEFDYSVFNSYLIKYYELKNQDTKREATEMLRDTGEKYKTALEQVVNFLNDNAENLTVLDRFKAINEIARLNGHIKSVFELIELWERDELTIEKARTTLETVRDEWNNSINTGVMYKVFTNIGAYKAINYTTRNDTDEEIEKAIYSLSGMTQDDLKGIWNGYDSEIRQNLRLTYRIFLKTTLRDLSIDEINKRKAASNHP